MWDRLCHVWLPRGCFVIAVAVALALAAAVFVAPWLAPSDSLVLGLFAHNNGVRGAAIASAAGLLVTAWVFFRATGPRPEKRSPREPPPGNMAGA
jgi:hypothetical protein